ncbi:MAG: tetratricopeptide repeat protein, partial [Candidatus Brocadiaceae bacterium]|nr:tetratricopeptide repeat protein [Candidatus Brocadiaceae bacterium]
SACMIVKNEEKFLAQCLKSIKDTVDEIIIVDTGSTDKTVEIAQSFGAKVYHHPWRNSFSEARNHSLSYATCDWILQIDADEALEQTDIPLLHKLIQTDSYNAIYVAIYSELPGGQSKHYYSRVFRRGKAHYEGIVHNQLILDGNAMPSETRLYHYGYNLSTDEMQKKYKRTGDLLRKQVAGNPNNIFALANLIRNYRNEYDFDKVIELGEKGLNVPVSQTDIDHRNQRLRIYIDLAYALLNTNQINRAEELCRDAISENPDSLDVLYVMGDILSRKGEFDDAINYFKRYLVIKDKENKNPAFNIRIVDTYYYEHKAYNNIGECYNRLGVLSKAEPAYKKAIELNNNESLYYSNLAHLHISQNRFQEAENITNTAIKLGIANHLICLLMGKAQIMQGKAHEAIHTFKQLIKKNSNDLNAHIFLVNLLLQTNQVKEAEEALKTITSSNSDNLELTCLMERIKFKNGDRQSVIKFIQNTLTSNPTDTSTYLKLGNLCIEIEDHATAIELLERYLEITPVDANVIATIAICYARLGKLESAIIGLKAALELDPACHYASQNLISLEKKFKNNLLQI